MSFFAIFWLFIRFDAVSGNALNFFILLSVEEVRPRWYYFHSCHGDQTLVVRLLFFEMEA